ncbi:MAG TPA: hypothetical protein VNA20_04220 [Frankiaceae bacterium]|nr:hypothetical protein [Frankiaceae bacterium]
MTHLRTVATAVATVAAIGGLTAAVPEAAPPVARVPVTPYAAAEPAEARARTFRAAYLRERVAAPAHDHSTHSHAPVAPVARPAAPAPAPAPARVAAARPARRVVWDGRAFATPEAAMRFLVAAYNAHDDAAIRHVTTPAARDNLLPMREFAPALRLTSCARVEEGAYDCEFTHSTRTSAAQTGYATFRVAPATRPGWYMTVLMDCGE